MGIVQYLKNFLAARRFQLPLVLPVELAPAAVVVVDSIEIQIVVDTIEYLPYRQWISINVVVVVAFV